MEIIHKINDEIKIVSSSWCGKIKDSDILLSYKMLYENKKWRPGFNEIVDFSKADLRAVSNCGLEQLAAIVEDYTKEKSKNFKSVVIAPQDLSFGLARVYEAHAPLNERVIVFRETHSALEYLSLKESALKTRGKINRLN